MKESHKFTLNNGNEVTVCELGQGDFAENVILLMMEEAECESMSLVLTREEAWAIGRALTRISYTGKGKE